MTSAMWTPTGERVNGVRRVHAGPLFDVFSASVSGRHVAIKRRRATVPGADESWRSSVGSYTHASDPTNIFVELRIGWTATEAVPDASHFEALLRAEHAVITYAGDAWNHPGAWLARWRGDDELIAPDVSDGGDGALCLVMPWCSGESFAALPRVDQRRLFPAMLPALWQALSVCPHGDLSPADLMLEDARSWFRIFDPGTRICGPSRSGRSQLTFESSMFTTNATYYPLVQPEHGPGRPRVTPPANLRAILEHHARPLFACEAPPELGAGRLGPAAADLVACGAIYAAVLTGVHLVAMLGINAPLWTGFWDDAGAYPEVPSACVDAIAGGAIARAIAGAVHAAALPAEAELCDRLVRLDLDAEQLARLVAEISGGGLQTGFGH